jgi:YrbI family 3-deoxy-D-manno-octulosonate 8-phosphate phosphatase
VNPIAQNKKVNLFDLDMLIFDFDGVFTNDQVTVHQDGEESVTCSRTDSLGISRLFRYLENRGIKLKLLVVSTETNPVVVKRCEKLKIDSHTGVLDKSSFLKQYSRENNLSLTRALYVGNDLNDLQAIKLVPYSFAPANADFRIKQTVTKVFDSYGGSGFVREVVEYLVPDLWDENFI